MLYFTYGTTETDYLKQRDSLLGKAIDEIGPIQREVTPNLFSSLVFQILSQQISTKGAATICARLVCLLGEVTPQSVCAASLQTIQQCGTSMRKATYIQAFAQTVQRGTLNLQTLGQLSDDALCKQLIQVKGIGIWTAEMLMIFSLQRPNIISYGDIAIHRGMRMLYRHRKITPSLFAKYKRLYAPYATVASLYLWAIAGGALPHVKDPTPSSLKKPN